MKKLPVQLQKTKNYKHNGYGVCFEHGGSAICILEKAADEIRAFDGR